MTSDRTTRPPVVAVVFDMDGVLVDTEAAWHEVRRHIALENGGHWDEDDQRAVMGMNSLQWSTYMRDRCDVPLPPEAIYKEVVRRLRERYREDLPLYLGATDAVRALAARFDLAVASSSPLELVEAVVTAAGLDGMFAALVSSDDVDQGKPAPDVYREACRRLAVETSRAVAVEDSTNGILAAVAAGLGVIAIPNEAFPPSADAVRVAARSLDSISELSVRVVETLEREIVDG